MTVLIPREHISLVDRHVKRLSALAEKGTSMYVIGKRNEVTVKPSARLHALAIHTAVLATLRHNLHEMLEKTIASRKGVESNEGLYLEESLRGLHDRATVQLTRAKKALDLIADSELKIRRRR